MRNLLIGNGVNIQHGGYAFGNAEIILRTLKCFKDPLFPKHLITDDPIEAKCYIGYLFLEIKRMISGKYDQYTNCTTERESLEEFKNKYKDKPSLKITDIGFEDYYLIHDLFCHRIGVDNPERYVIRESIKSCFLNSIYDNGKVNTAYSNYSIKFIEWLNDFDQIFTTNYDNNIESATGKTIFHLHGDFFTRSAIYTPDSFKNQLSDQPSESCIIDVKYPHLYSTALTTYSGDYKQYFMQEGELANDAVEKMASTYQNNPIVQNDVDSWDIARNELLEKMKKSILLKVKNPDLKFEEPYPIKPLRNLSGELVILGLSPFNDRHLFKIINDSAISNCTFYYYDEKETESISSLLNNFQIKYEDAHNFWKSSVTSKTAMKNKNKRIVFKNVASSDFNKFAECYRGLSASTLSDNDIVRQFNATPYSIRVQICNRIKELKVEREYAVNQQFVLSVVDLHVIAGEFNVDPAVVCCIGADQCRNEYIRLQ